VEKQKKNKGNLRWKVCGGWGLNNIFRMIKFVMVSGYRNS